MEQVLHDVPHKVLSHGQNQCPKGKNLKLPTEFYGIYPRGMGEAVGLHPSLPAPQDGKLAHALELQRGAYAHVKGARRCRC